MQSRGAVRVRYSYSEDNLEWLALHQLAGMSATKILKQFVTLNLGGGESTILKGVKTAATLLHWTASKRRDKKSSR